MREPCAPRRQAMFLLAGHLAEGTGMTVGQEHRIIAETLVAARRPNQRTLDRGFEVVGVPVGPGGTERGDEMRGALTGTHCSARAQLVLHGCHGVPEVLLRRGPARGI